MATKTAPAKGRKILAEQTEIVRALWYSDPAKGKTTAMAHLAKLGHVIYVDAEQRLKRRTLQRMGVPVENIEVYTDCRFEALEELAIETGERVHDGEAIVGVVLDSITEIYKQILEGATEYNIRKAEAQNKTRDLYTLFQEDYGVMTEQVRRLLRRFRDIPVHLGVSALTRRDQDEEGAVRVIPAVTPAVHRDLMGYMDLVMFCQYAEIGDVEEYSALTRPRGRWDAKDSFGLFPPVFVHPTFDRVVAYVNEEIDRATDPVQIAARKLRENQAVVEAEKANDESRVTAAAGDEPQSPRIQED